MKKLYKIKEYLPGVLAMLAMAVFAFNSCTTTIDERGFLGMGKYGRQILLQTMDYYASELDPTVNVTSEFYDFSWFERLWQEPMRTTLRINKTMNDDEYLQFRIAQGYADVIPEQNMLDLLDIPYSEFLNNYTSEITMSEDYSLTKEELEALIAETGVVTYRDLLRGFGFTKYEFYINGALKSSIMLNPNVTNHMEGEFMSTIGSIKNERIKN